MPSCALCRRVEREMLANQSALEFHLHGLALVGNLLLRSLGMRRRDETEGQLALANHLWVVTLQRTHGAH